MGRKDGFTLIELMIVVAIIGIIASILVPKVADLITRSQESAVKGQLGALRSAVNVYYSDNDGTFPTNLNKGLLNGSQYLQVLPPATIPPVTAQNSSGHPNRSGALDGDGSNIAPGEPTPFNMWYYINQTNNQGVVVVNCTHNDSKGTMWSTE